MNFSIKNKSAPAVIKPKTNHNIFRLKNSKSLPNYLVIKDTDYVPLSFISFPVAARPGFSNWAADSYYPYWRNYPKSFKNQLTTINTYDSYDKNEKYINDLISTNVNRYDIGSIEDLQKEEDYTIDVKEKIINETLKNQKAALHYIETEIGKFNLRYHISDIKQIYGRDSYKNIFDRVNNGLSQNHWQHGVFDFTEHRLRLSKYLASFGFLAIIENENFNVLFSYMVKTEMVPYIKMCMVLGEEPHPDALELWVNDKLDVTRGEYKNIRSKYRKEVKKDAQQKGIKIENCSNINDSIFKSYNLPKFKKMADKKEWYNFVSSGLLDAFAYQQLCNKREVNFNLYL